MTRRARKVLLTARPAALAIVLGAASSSAAATATWTVSPGGAVSASGPAQVKDTKTGTAGKCATARLSGTLKSGSGLSSSLGTVTSASFTGCTIATIPVTVTVHGLPWKVKCLSYNRATGVALCELTGIDIGVSAPGCSFVIDGTAAGADDGVAEFTYTDSTGKGKFNDRGNLHTWAVSVCFGLVSNGDYVSLTGSFTLSPKQVITSP